MGIVLTLWSHDLGVLEGGTELEPTRVRGRRLCTRVGIPGILEFRGLGRALAAMDVLLISHRGVDVGGGERGVEEKHTGCPNEL